jgi:hypothetical protein
VAASVLGEEVERAGIGAVSELGAELDDALSELVSGGLLTEAQGQTETLYRFRHALIQEATYNGLLRSQRRALHARAAWDLEARSAGRLEEVAAVLGRHFAAAGESERAAHYLEVAGDHAARAFANEEAIASYRQALAVIDSQSERGDANQLAAAAARSATAAALAEKLALVLMTIDRFDEAEAAALAGLAWVGPEAGLQAARLQHLLAKIEGQARRFDAALTATDAAQALIGPVGLDDDQERVDLWLLVRLSAKPDVYRWRHELRRGAALIESTRPLVEARGSQEALAHFYWALAMQHLAERRYRVDHEVIGEYRRAMEAARASAAANYDLLRPEWTLGWTMRFLAIALTWHGDLAEARQLHGQALAIAERQGSPVVRGAELAELAVIAMRRGEVEVVRELATRARAEAVAGGYPFCLAAATALQAWVAWREGRIGEALVLGTEALEAWEPHPHFYPYNLSLWPLAGAHLGSGHLEEAVGAARRLLEPSYARLPDELEAAVRAACDAFDSADPELASRLLADAVQLARHLGYA